MRNALQVNATFTRIEFWAVTTIFAFVLFFFIADGLDGSSALESTSYKSHFKKAGVPFSFYKNYFIPQLVRNGALFLALLYLNFIVIPELIRKQRLMLNIVLVAFVFLVLGVISGVTDTYVRGYSYGSYKERDAPDQIMLWHSFADTFTVLAVFAIYTIIKYASLYLIAISGTIQSKYAFIRREGIVATVIWLIVLLLLVIAGTPTLAIAGWVIAIPSAILLYLAGFYTLIPSSLNQKYPFLSYALKNALILFLILMAWGLILKLVVGGVVGGDKAPLVALWVFNSVLQMCITVPIIWAVYKRKMKGDEQLNVLKKELGQSNASFDFLRSQINPHFLFNALNTIYGTALQEGADRTSDAVQKLGDMMRFMLQENMKEKISLLREIEYLDNYISLQKLRTVTQPDIMIQTKIELDFNGIEVAPMLFIPFVENAFKHGISFREPSYISIALKVNGSTVNFDVQNSTHPRQLNDPETDKSGIGLVNVKQRLQLLYPGRHELAIHETAKDFSIYLTLQIT